MARAFLVALLFCFSVGANAQLQINFVYLSLEVDSGPLLSNILPDPEDQGLRGVELAINDSNTTGRFLKQKYEFDSFRSDQAQDILDHANAAYAEGKRLFIADLPTLVLRSLTKTLPADALIFNATNADDQLRLENCSANVFHTYPSRAMLTDALAQWIKKKNLSKVLIIKGQREEDTLYANAFKRAAKRFGVKVVDELTWDFDTDLRRTAQSELPLFTQTKEYDLVIVADEVGDFGEYVPYNTWYPRPVAGTQGMTPVAWHRVVEQWGAAQLQSRFEELTGRWMNGKDYAAWVAVRSVAEAVTRTKSVEPTVVRQFIRSDDFELAAFKGRKLSYRTWNQQFRQPIPLIHPRALVSQSPQDGFLHPKNELDTLGYDKPESQCDLQ